VDIYGQLRVDGNKIVDKNGAPILLRGMSLFWSQWMGKYYNYDCVKWLRDDWKCTVVRIALGIEPDGYLANPDSELVKARTVIDACRNLGIYVIIDWHDHNAHTRTALATAFFRNIALSYGHTPNVIYEIFNEPTQISWNDDIKPYAETVIQNIRSIDPDNLIIVGTPTWSQDVDIASMNQLLYDNVAYSLHFYAATHKQFLRNKATIALNNGAALFVSEFGTCESSGSGILDSSEVENWLDFLENNSISWCNWSIADKNETSAALKSGANPKGGWSLSALTASGFFIRWKIQSSNDTIFALLQNGGG